jgi:hypothetical protein
MVAQIESNWNLILLELSRWKNISRGEDLLSSSTAQH